MERNIVNNAFYEDLGEKWYSESAHPIALLRSENAARIPWVLKHIGFEPKTVLDIGCGAGYLTNALARKGHTVTGIDLSSNSLQVAREYDVTGSVEYLSADATKLPFPDQTFEVVSAMDLLEHVEDPAKVIQEAGRVLKPNGLFFFHTFNRNWFSGLLVIKGVELCVKNTPKNLHLYRYFIKPSEITAYCQNEQMKVKEIKGLVPNMRTKAFWKMLLTRKVPEDFTFKITDSTTCGYVGLAIKKSD